MPQYFGKKLLTMTYILYHISYIFKPAAYCRLTILGHEINPGATRCGGSEETLETFLRQMNRE